MAIINNIKEYRKYVPEYKDWRDKQELDAAKRTAYLRQNPSKLNKDDIQKGKNLLHAIDVMDEYSQSYAENMEVATEFAQNQIISISSTAGMFGGMLLAQTKGVSERLAKIGGANSFVFATMMPSIIGMLVGAAVSFPAIMLATKAQVGASRRGRFEAMKKDLSNPAIFATLTDEQAKKADEIARTITIDKKQTKKNVLNNRSNPIGIFKTLKDFFSNQKEYEAQRAEFNKKIDESEKNFNKSLTENQVKKAKHDQQLLAHIVRKLDVASQDYAENTELATNTISAIALAGGGLVGWVSNKIIQMAKVSPNNKLVKVIPWAVGAAIPLTMGIYSAKLQKQASRIGRFKAKQEMLNNPESLVYVDKKDSDKMTNVTVPGEKSNKNIFKFIVQLFKDNKEYNKYKKTTGIEEQKRHKAVEKLDLTQEQADDAKVLQTNVFKTFNKVDEKSQTYAESVEAAGEMVKQGVSVFGSLGASIFSMRTMIKMMENPEKIKELGYAKSILKAVAPVLVVLIPVIGIDIITTKSQKKASRVADMTALKELEDYRHYAGYKDNGKNEQTFKSNKPQSTNLLNRFLGK